MSRIVASLKIIAVSVCIAMVSACQMPAEKASSGRFGSDSPRGGANVTYDFSDVTADVQAGAVQRGNDSFFDAEAIEDDRPPQARVVPAGNGTVEMSLVNASIEAAASAVLGDTLGLNYVVSDKVSGRITLQTTGPVPKAVLLELFETALASNGAEIRKEGGVYNVVPGGSSGTFGLAGRSGAAPIMVAPLKYVSANEMAGLLEPLTDDGLRIVVDKKRNLLLLSGPQEQRTAALDALNLFDVDVLAGKSVALVQLNSADPEAVVDELNRIFESEEGGMLSGVVEFIPNRRLSAVLVVTSRAQYLSKAQRWIRELDTTASGASLYLATYLLQNRSAAEVAPILNDLLTTSGDGSASQGTEGDDSAASGGVARVQVAADDSRNALIVRARRADHAQVKALLAQLDNSPRQVLLEATIAEVTLSDELSLGTRWFFESGNWGFRFSDSDTGSVAANNTGFAGIFKAGGAELAISALQGVTDVKIISAPTLMVIDNKEGVLQIGDQVPIATQTSASSDAANAPVLTKIEYRDTGVILRVRPRIGNSGRVLLEITQEVSDVKQTKTSGIDSPTIRQRKLQTNVALGDGQTLALGGLVQETDNQTETETPGLGKIPVVGNLFRRKESTRSRSELLILIRPRVIGGDAEAAVVTDYWRGKLNTANSLLGSGLGGPTHTLNDFVE